MLLRAHIQTANCKSAQFESTVVFKLLLLFTLNFFSAACGGDTERVCVDVCVCVSWNLVYFQDPGCEHEAVME